MFIVRIGWMGEDPVAIEVEGERPTAGELLAMCGIGVERHAIVPKGKYFNFRFTGADRVELAHYGTDFWVVTM